MKIQNKNLFIVLEGIDRSGKTTLWNLISKKINAVKFNFPDRTTNTGKKIDNFLKQYCENVENIFDNKEINEKLHLLFRDNRLEKIPFILKTLENHDIICDRYSMSGIVYSISKGLNEKWVKDSEKDLPIPDITFFLDVSPEISFKRQDFGNEIHDTIEFQKKVYENYLKNKDYMIFVKNDTIENMLNEILNYINRFKINRCKRIP